MRKQRRQGRGVSLTANATTPYILGFPNLGRTGPLVIEIPAGGEVAHVFESWLNAYWVRFVADEDGILSAQLTYE